MEFEDIFGVFLGIMVGIMLAIVLCGVFGVFQSPQVKLCDDLSVIIGTNTRIFNSECQIKEGLYFIDYPQWIELQSQ